MAKLESDKIELSWGINSFNKPTELTGGKAWAKLVTNLLFMPKGSYPTEPDMGCELQKYDFMFIDDVKDDIEKNIRDQISTYLPDIPLSEIIVSSETIAGQRNIMVIILKFTEKENESIVVAAEKVNNLINFEVSL